MTRLLTSLLAVLVLVVLPSCHGKSSTAPSSLTAGSPNGSIPCTAGITGTTTAAHGTMTAQINGTSWTADCFGVLVTPSTISIAGADLKASSQLIGFGTAKAVGTTTVGLPSVLNGSLTLINTSGNVGGWTAGLTIGSGTAQITSLTSNSVAGTFSFVMQPQAATSASGTKTITNGAFNLTF